MTPVTRVTQYVNPNIDDLPYKEMTKQENKPG